MYQHEDIAVGKLLKWIVKTDQSFTTVDNEHFQDYVNYLKSDVSIASRRTIMRRLEDMYDQNKQELKAKLNDIGQIINISLVIIQEKLKKRSYSIIVKNCGEIMT